MTLIRKKRQGILLKKKIPIQKFQKKNNNNIKNNNSNKKNIRNNKKNKPNRLKKAKKQEIEEDDLFNDNLFQDYSSSQTSTYSYSSSSSSSSLSQAILTKNRPRKGLNLISDDENMMVISEEKNRNNEDIQNNNIEDTEITMENVKLISSLLYNKIINTKEYSEEMYFNLLNNYVLEILNFNNNSISEKYNNASTFSPSMSSINLTNNLINHYNTFSNLTKFLIITIIIGSQCCNLYLSCFNLLLSWERIGGCYWVVQEELIRHYLIEYALKYLNEEIKKELFEMEEIIEGNDREDEYTIDEIESTYEEIDNIKEYKKKLIKKINKKIKLLKNNNIIIINKIINNSMEKNLLFNINNIILNYYNKKNFNNEKLKLKLIELKNNFNLLINKIKEILLKEITNFINNYEKFYLKQLHYIQNFNSYDKRNKKYYSISELKIDLITKKNHFNDKKNNNLNEINENIQNVILNYADNYPLELYSKWAIDWCKKILMKLVITESNTLLSSLRNKEIELENERECKLEMEKGIEFDSELVNYNCEENIKEQCDDDKKKQQIPSNFIRDKFNKPNNDKIIFHSKQYNDLISSSSSLTSTSSNSTSSQMNRNQIILKKFTNASPSSSHLHNSNFFNEIPSSRESNTPIYHVVQSIDEEEMIDSDILFQSNSLSSDENAKQNENGKKTTNEFTSKKIIRNELHNIEEDVLEKVNSHDLTPEIISKEKNINSIQQNISFDENDENELNLQFYSQKDINYDKKSSKNYYNSQKINSSQLDLFFTAPDPFLTAPDPFLTALDNSNVKISSPSSTSTIEIISSQTIDFSKNNMNDINYDDEVNFFSLNPVRPRLSLQYVYDEEEIEAKKRYYEEAQDYYLNPSSINPNLAKISKNIINIIERKQEEYIIDKKINELENELENEFNDIDLDEFDEEYDINLKKYKKCNENSPTLSLSSLSISSNIKDNSSNKILLSQPNLLALTQDEFSEAEEDRQEGFVETLKKSIWKYFDP